MSSLSTFGVIAGLTTAILWTFTAVCFEGASRRIGSLGVNVWRLAIAALLFSTLSLVRTGHWVPTGIPRSGLVDLSLSGLVGFVLGDLLLFRAFALIGARMSMLVYASVPLLTTAAGFVWLGETVSARALLGMLTTVTGIALAVGAKPTDQSTRGPATAPAPRGSRVWGIILGLGASLGQAAGLLLGKRGSLGQNFFAATHVRVLAGLAGFLALMLLSGRGPGVVRPLLLALGRPLREQEGPPLSRRTSRVAFGLLGLGAILGPFLGVSLGLLSTQLLPTGIASTLMSLVPVLLIPVSIFVLRERVRLPEAIGSVVAVTGVALMMS
jgi:drug/metabolite transporter (DMT)-like permease